MRLVVRWLIRSRRQIGGLRRYRARDRAYDGNTEREQSIHRSIPLTPEFNRPRVVRQRLANGLVSRRTDHASRATSALARACSVVRAGTTHGAVRTRTDRSQPSANFESMPTTEFGETNPLFHFGIACRIPHVSDLLDCLPPPLRVPSVTSGLAQTRRGPGGSIREYSRREWRRSA